MANLQENDPHFSPSLDKLAQLRNLGIENLEKRARSKYYTTNIVGPLLHLDSALHKQYERAFYCCNKITQVGQKLTSQYCNSRVCNICNRIRTAKAIKGYLPQFSLMENPQFLTLTIPNVPGESLKKTIEEMQIEFVKIKDKLRKRGIVIKGVRKFECTHNNRRKDFHPHYHFILNGHGEEIIEEWLKAYPFARKKSQDVRKANKDSLNELFKYSTKIVDTHKGSIRLHVGALDTIMNAINGKRIFQPFGKIRHVKEDIEEEDLKSQTYDIEYQELMEWNWKQCDWINEFCDTLTGYIPPEDDFIIVK